MKDPNQHKFKTLKQIIQVQKHSQIMFTAKTALARSRDPQTQWEELRINLTYAKPLVIRGRASLFTNRLHNTTFTSLHLTDKLV